MRVGVVGVGAMGAPVASAFAETHDVSAFDLDRERLAAVASSGITAARSLAELLAGIDVLVTVLPGAAETEAVIRESLPLIAPGVCWVDLATGDPRITGQLVRDLRDRGVGSVAATMGGGPSSAASRELHLTVAGEPESVRRVRPLLDPLTDHGIDVIGADPADAQTVKLLSNLLWFGQVVAVTEAMLLGRALGFEPAALRLLLAGRSGSSVLLERDYESVLRGDHMADFGIHRVVEQLATASSLAREHAVPFELSALIERTHRAALAEFGPIGGELLAAKLLEERDGEQFSSARPATAVSG